MGLLVVTVCVEAIAAAVAMACAMVVLFGLLVLLLLTGELGEF